MTIAAILLSFAPLFGQDQTASEETANSARQFAERQREIARNFERLEQILLRMSELSAASDPARAALVTKAVAESRQRLIGVQFASLADQLSKDELAKALEGQEQLNQDLADLLNLLLSENRSKRLASEKARIREYLKQLNQIINQQKSLQARTTGGAGQPGQLSDQQAALGEQTEGLADEIRQNEEAKTDTPTPKDSDGKPSEEKSAEDNKEDSSQNAADQQGPKYHSGDSSGREKGDPKPSDTGEPQPGGESKSPSEQESKEPAGEGGQQGGTVPESSSQPPSQEAHPARERLEQARQRMQQAQENLKKAEREGAGREQEEAIRELQQAKAELERILRQLREEEIEQVLVALEARLIKMLQMQREVYEGTERLDKASADELTHEQEIEAGRLSSREVEIVAEADKALMLLREDGSSVAMPEALAQARDDMEQVAARLARANVGQVTLAIEEDIISALDEMLQSVRQAMEDAEERRQNAQQGRPGMAQDPVLVDVLAELRMIRTLQLRVNTRTERYGKLITGKHAETPELQEALIRLGERQERVYQITSELEAGKNR